MVGHILSVFTKIWSYFQLTEHSGRCLLAVMVSNEYNASRQTAPLTPLTKLPNEIVNFVPFVLRDPECDLHQTLIISRVVSKKSKDP